MSTFDENATGLAALSVCETILLTLVEEELVDRDRVQLMLEDALEAHLAVNEGEDQALHKKAAMLVEDVIVSLNAVRRNDRGIKPLLVRKLALAGNHEED